ncbi:B-type cyclin [Rhizina undulata]
MRAQDDTEMVINGQTLQITGVDRAMRERRNEMLANTKPLRPVRPLRLRQDENINHQTTHEGKKVTTASGVAVAGASKSMESLKSGVVGPRRAAFGDVSNTTKLTGNASEKDKGKGGISLVHDKQVKITGAISKPALRPSNIKTGGLSAAPHAAPLAQPATTSQNVVVARKIVRKTTVYEDKRPSPKRASPPKVSRDAVVKKDAQQILSKQRSKSRLNQAPTRPALGVAKTKQSTEEAPAPSDQHSHQYSEGYLDEEDEDNNGVEIEEYDENEETEVDEPSEDVAKPEIDRINDAPEIEALSDYETDEGEDQEDETQYTTARSHFGGDNTTGVTLVVIPRWTAEDKKELQAVQKNFISYDDDDEGDISMVAEYGDEIFEYMRELEAKMLPNANYMDHQSEIKWSMRAILMDWIIQVHHRFNLLPETLFLCANYIDRFLSSKVVSLGKLQLVGATALFVAAKYEEINCPSVHEIVYMVDGGYTAEEILKAERFMLSMLQFELGFPGPMSFLRRISKADDYDLETRTLAKYFLEVTVMDERFVGSPPSFLAAGAHCLSRHMLKKGDWTPAHTFFSGYTASQLQPLLTTLIECCENPKNHHNAVYEKFADKRFKRASLFVETWMATEGESTNDDC